MPTKIAQLRNSGQGWRVVLAANGYPAFIPPATIDPDRRPRQHHRYRLALLTSRRRN